jgi:predicted nucleic acid-binding protein
MEYEEIIANKYNIEVAKNVIRTLLILPNVKRVNVYYQWNLITTDKDDNKFVDCAICANANMIVTEDKHFNILNQIDFPEVNVVSIADFKFSLLDN